jgi:hypothetical protein
VGSIIKAPKDFWTGVIYLGVGALGILVGREYSFGSAGRMGPGYFPFYISCLLLVFGVVTVVRQTEQKSGRSGCFAISLFRRAAVRVRRVPLDAQQQRPWLRPARRAEGQP